MGEGADNAIAGASRPRATSRAWAFRLQEAIQLQNEFFLLTQIANSVSSRPALLIEGRLRRQSRWQSEVWRPAAAACNRRLGRHGVRPPGTTTRLREASLHALRRTMPETEARTPGPKIATVERREASASGGTRPRLASAD